MMKLPFIAKRHPRGGDMYFGAVCITGGEVYRSSCAAASW